MYISEGETPHASTEGVKLTTALVPTTTQTAREFLASLNPPLAKAGPGVRGRFSTAGVEALTAARAAGTVFADDVKVVKTATATVAPAAAPAPTPAPVVSTPAVEGTVNAKDARAWAKANGIAVGERGRLHPDVLNAFAAATGTAGVKPKVSLVKATPVTATPLDMPKRKQTVAYGRIARKEGDGQHISEAVLGIESCAKCKKGIRFCPCDAPRLPKWAGYGIASFDRPVV